MQKALLLLGALALVSFGVHQMTQDSQPLSSTFTLQQAQWHEFKTKFSKSYDALEEVYRFSVFVENLRKIEEHNASGSSWTMGITNFADLTQSEFHALYIGPKWDMSKLKNRPPRISEIQEKPSKLKQTQTVNWTQKPGIVGPVNNQGQCGSCWSFSATESIQSALAVAGQPLVQLSEEQLVQCSGAYGNEGCNGGWPYQAFEYVMANPLNLLSDYPYTSGDGVTGTCNTALASKGTYTISTYNDVPANCDSLQSALLTQPVSVCVDAANWSALYHGGIYPADECGTEIDHAVLLVGSSSTSWLIQNSWGASWGENGYIQLAPGNTCAVCNVASVPIA